MIGLTNFFYPPVREKFFAGCAKRISGSDLLRKIKQDKYLRIKKN